MKTEELEKRITKYAEKFETYTKRAQCMQKMLAMCIKAGLPMPKLEDLKEFIKKEGSIKAWMICRFLVMKSLES